MWYVGCSMVCLVLYGIRVVVWLVGYFYRVRDV